MEEKKTCDNCHKEKKVCDFEFMGMNPEDDSSIYADICDVCDEAMRAASEEAMGTCKSVVKKKGVKKKVGVKKKTVKANKNADPENIDAMGISLAACAQCDLKKLNNYDEEMFILETGIVSPLDFEDIVANATEHIVSITGLNYPENVTLTTDQSYVVFGNTHGSEVHDGILKCVENMCEHIGARPVHIGSAFDNDYIVSRKLKEMDNLVIVAASHEAGRLGKMVGSKENITLVRERVTAGNALFRCQYYRSLYTSGSTKSAVPDNEGYQLVVIDRPLHEMHTLTKHGRHSFVASTGSSCHTFKHKPKLKNKTPKDEDELHRHWVMATATGRRKSELVKDWETGFVVVHVDEDGVACPIPCRLKLVDGKWTTGYMGTVITEDSVVRGDLVEMVVGDLHVPEHDPKALSVAENVASLILPDKLINVGDHCNSSSLNHFSRDRGEPIMDSNVVDEYGMAHYVLVLMASWARERVLIMGNHERFIEDFNKKEPPLEPLINQYTLMATDSTGFSVVPIKGVYKSGKSVGLHGEMRHYGVPGDLAKKISLVFGTDAMYGHCHRPSIRAGAYGIGLLGLYDQGYNETESSNWVHGFGISTHYRGEVFMNSLSIINYRTVVGDRWVTFGDDIEKWKPKKFRADIAYTVKGANPSVDGYEPLIYDLAPAVFGRDDTDMKFGLWTGLPCDELGGMTPASFLSSGNYKPVYTALVSLLNKD